MPGCFRKRRSFGPSQNRTSLLFLQFSCFTNFPSTDKIAPATIILLSGLALLLHLDFPSDCGIDRQLEDFIHTIHFLARALKVCRAHLLSDILSLLLSDGGQALSLEEVDAGAFSAEIGFEPNEDKGGGGAEMEDFWIPLEVQRGQPWGSFSVGRVIDDCRDAYFVHYILEGVRAIDSEANEKQVCLWVRERTQTVIFFLSGSIPKRKLNRFPSWLVVGMGDVVLEDCGDIFLLTISAPPVNSTFIANPGTYLREDTLAIADQKTSLSTAPIADDHEFL